MPARRRAPRSPQQELVLAVERLSRRRQYVTFADIGGASERAGSRLEPADLSELVESAVAESILFKDRRTFFDRKTGGFSEHWVYRVNPRHPLVADLFDES